MEIEEERGCDENSKDSESSFSRFCKDYTYDANTGRGRDRNLGEILILILVDLVRILLRETDILFGEGEQRPDMILANEPRADDNNGRKNEGKKDTEEKLEKLENLFK